MLQCPKCESARVHRSRTRSAWERWRREITGKSPFRCQRCGWRGWKADLGPLFTREEIEAANRALTGNGPDEEIPMPPRREPRPDPDLTTRDARRPPVEIDITALDERFSKSS